MSGMQKCEIGQCGVGFMFRKRTKVDNVLQCTDLRI